MNLLKEIQNYVPNAEQEEQDKQVMLEYLNTFDNVLTRQNQFGHFTASAFVVNKKRDKTVFIYHNIYQSWAWTGGHADGEQNLLEVAIREVKEETGIKTIVPIETSIYAIDVLTVAGHKKNNKYVSSHVHLNVTYLLEADENEELIVKPDENSGVQWIPISEIEKFSTEKEMHKVYQKLVKKLSSI